MDGGSDGGCGWEIRGQFPISGEAELLTAKLPACVQGTFTALVGGIHICFVGIGKAAAASL